MLASFIADGPFAQHLKRRQNEVEGGLLKRILPSVFGATAESSAAKPLVIDGFNNVELYGLVVKMLGIEKYAAPNDGTRGFWDRYFSE